MTIISAYCTGNLLCPGFIILIASVVLRLNYEDLNEIK
jgi:hypothetical protein